ncbi:hypothetical protein TREMEDRAFT_65574 [Tremella mesenterica DSM 1558]|uniref:uncharacterized protein n=1 Tax=Tremella mesenterica (strain ATCC 24925 / CBS 8224 / DSM 1558 / NBRC 9311 / NRRL Y-6157 / RJB 2259-6 / UBC 559-6) TaxID=578456 RepID=UPI00032C4AA8|nr:uncharacterized protein TREMEDRAFT_65574 [Tremella mesenterica DSM 1558]EIW66303.1 hypothetical protein TREMEDRAFT_65574 [Tremella mesenterica DSM 1558]
MPPPPPTQRAAPSQQAPLSQRVPVLSQRATVSNQAPTLGTIRSSLAAQSARPPSSQPARSVLPPSSQPRPRPAAAYPPILPSSTSIVSRPGSVPVYQPPTPSPSLLGSVSGRHVVDSYRPPSAQSQGSSHRLGVEGSGGPKWGEQIMVFLEAQEQNRVIQHRDSVRGIEALHEDIRTLFEGQASLHDDNRALRNEVKLLREANVDLSHKLERLLEQFGQHGRDSPDIKDQIEELRNDIHELHIEQKAIPNKDELVEELQVQFSTPLSELLGNIGRVLEILESLKEMHRATNEARSMDMTRSTDHTSSMNNAPLTNNDTLSTNNPADTTSPRSSPQTEVRSLVRSIKDLGQQVKELPQWVLAALRTTPLPPASILTEVHGFITDLQERLKVQAVTSKHMQADVSVMENLMEGMLNEMKILRIATKVGSTGSTAPTERVVHVAQNQREAAENSQATAQKEPTKNSQPTEQNDLQEVPSEHPAAPHTPSDLLSLNTNSSGHGETDSDPYAYVDKQTNVTTAKRPTKKQAVYAKTKTPAEGKKTSPQAQQTTRKKRVPAEPLLTQNLGFRRETRRASAERLRREAAAREIIDLASSSEAANPSNTVDDLASLSTPVLANDGQPRAREESGSHGQTGPSGESLEKEKKRT